MIAQSFSHVCAWVFDLDNTLYPPEARLFDQIEIRMTDWVMQSLNVTKQHADRLRRDYWAKYGTTLSGLMREHDVDPGPYLHDVHDIDMSHLKADPILRREITALPGRKIVYTNGSAPYAERVLAARGLSDLFDAVYGVEHAGFKPKPETAAFETIFKSDGILPGNAAMFEDDPRNLSAPHDLGMRTVLVAPLPVERPYIHFHTDDLAGFLSQLGNRPYAAT